jgi:hypothetical protein
VRVGGGLAQRSEGAKVSHQATIKELGWEMMLWHIAERLVIVASLSISRTPGI